MKVYQAQFRETYRKICLLSNSEVLDKINLREIFDYPPSEKIDGYLAYGYIDEQSGFNFKILAGARLEGEKIKIFPCTYKRGKSIRRAEIEDAEIKILPDNFAAAFRDKIKVLDDAFAFDADREKTRLIKTIDNLRHPNFPDDVAVYFHGENFEPEPAWVRCVEVRENLIAGKLLHELKQNFGVHTGDRVIFGVADFNGENICAVIDL